MGKKILIFILISMSVFIAGCTSQVGKQSQIQTVSNIQSKADNTQLNNNITIVDNSATKDIITKTDTVATQSKKEITKTNASEAKKKITIANSSEAKKEIVKTDTPQLNKNVTIIDNSDPNKNITNQNISAINKDITKTDIFGLKNDLTNSNDIKIESDSIISRDDAMKIVDKWCEWNNGTVQAFPENDKVKDGVRYYYFSVSFTSEPIENFFIQSINGDIYAASIQKDINTDDTPLNKQSQDNKVAYKQYSNDKFGFSIDYPNTFVIKSLQANKDVLIFSTLDGSEELTVEGMNNTINETAISVYNKLLKEHSDTIFKSQVENWMLVSWMDGNKIVYEKVVVGIGSINTFIIKYPSSEKDYYDPIISNLNSTFKTPSIANAH